MVLSRTFQPAAAYSNFIPSNQEVICFGQWLPWHKSFWHKGLRFRSTDPLIKALISGCSFCKSFIHNKLRLPSSSIDPLSKGGVGGCTIPSHHPSPTTYFSSPFH